MLKALLPVDGSESSDRAVQHLISLIQGRGPMEVLLINVQPPVDALEVTSHLPAGEIRRWQEIRGNEELASARALLDAAGIAYMAQVVVGDVGQTIVDLAQQHGCDKIIMGIRGLEAIPGLLLGSVARKVLHLANVPVTLVK